MAYSTAQGEWLAVLHHEEAVRELARLGVAGRAVWAVQRDLAVVPGLSVGADTYTTPEATLRDAARRCATLRDPSLALEWALIVATHARGVRA